MAQVKIRTVSFVALIMNLFLFTQVPNFHLYVKQDRLRLSP